MGRLTGKTALVTGASRGIGAAIAVRLGQEGARVIVNYAASRERAEQVAAEIRSAGSQALLAQADVCDPLQVNTMMLEIGNRTGGIDILINNAGQGTDPGFLKLEDITPDNFDRVFNLNVRGLFFVTQGAVRLMPDNGRIIMISSLAALGRMAGLAIYSASKAAVDALARNISIELAPRGITVNSLNVGMIETELTAQIDNSMRKALIRSIPMGRIGRVNDVGEVVAFLSSEESRWITGESIAVSGGSRG